MTLGERLWRDDVGAVTKLFDSLGFFVLPSCRRVFFMCVFLVRVPFYLFCAFLLSSVFFLASLFWFSTLSFPFFSSRLFYSLSPIFLFLSLSLSPCSYHFPILYFLSCSSPSTNFTILKVISLFTSVLDLRSSRSITGVLFHDLKWNGVQEIDHFLYRAVDLRFIAKFRRF